MPRIAVDLDGVLAQYSGQESLVMETPDGRAPSPIGDPVPGAVEFVRELLRRGWKVQITTQNRHPLAVADWLVENGLAQRDEAQGAIALPPGLELSPFPREATVILDDRAVRFEGDFGPILAFLSGDPRPYWRKG